MTALPAAAVELARMTAERDRLAGRLDMLCAAIEAAEQGAATVVRIDLVRGLLGRRRPGWLTADESVGGPR